MEQGRCAVVHAFHLAPREGRPVLPIAVYAVPEVACVGLTEDQCREGGERYAVGRATYDQNARGQIIGDLTGMVKLIFAPSDLKLLGVHILGESASELIHLGAHVLNEGGTIETFVRTVFNYPTLSELYKYAAYDGLGKVEPMKAPPSDTL
jgi:NAD(P) transhydrogenase